MPRARRDRRRRLYRGGVRRHLRRRSAREVDLVYRQPLPLRGFDHDLREALAEALTDQGITLHPGCAPRSLEPRRRRARADVSATARSLTADLVFFATGRAPATRGARAGPGRRRDRARRRGRRWTRICAPTQPHIYAIGDVTDRLNLTPVATAEGHALADSLFGQHAAHGLAAQRADRGVLHPADRHRRADRGAGGRRRARPTSTSASFTPMRHTLTGPGAQDADEAGGGPGDARRCSARTCWARTRRRSCRAWRSR